MELQRWQPRWGLRPWWRPSRDLGLFRWPTLSLWERWPDEMTMNPDIEVIDKKDKYIVKAELPGMEEADIDVSIAGNLLTVKGEKCTEAKTDENDYYYRECSYGSFSRAIPIPAEFNEDKVTAEYGNGVLEISLPKIIETKTKKVSVAKKKEKTEAKAEKKEKEKAKAVKKESSKVKGEKKEKKAKK